MYYGEEVLSFPELDNGFVIFSRKLIAGGNKEDRNKAQYDYDLLIGSECTIRIGDLINPSNDEPKYEISVIGYIPMHSIKAE